MRLALLTYARNIRSASWVKIISKFCVNARSYFRRAGKKPWDVSTADNAPGAPALRRCAARQGKQTGQILSGRFMLP
eukprot:6175263-Pleurochrysis_carterae.AAC.3